MARRTCAEAAFGAVEVSGVKVPPRVQRTLTIVDTLLCAASYPFSRDINGYTPMEYAVINGNNDLFWHLVRSIPNHSTENNRAIYEHELRETLSSAWSLSIEKEQWFLVKGLLLSPLDFGKDMSLFRWPVGARFLEYSICAAQGELERSYFAIPKRMALCRARAVWKIHWSYSSG